MEPGRGGQEKLSRVAEVATVRARRNGAWPWRPGKVALRQTVGGGNLVAMEPGLGGQEKRPSFLELAPSRGMSQWSLALAARKRVQSAR